MKCPSQRGFVAWLAAALLGAGALLLVVLNAMPAASARREAASERALAQAREALVVHAAERPPVTGVGPGFLPCPDLDDDGWAEATCGSLAGDRGQAERLGRLPWKTLGLPDLRDGHGERLWYAVSTRYKGLLNCAASPACVEMTPATALGTITVRDRDGRILQDGRLADADRGGAAAVVIAPGPPLSRLASAAFPAREQRRECPPPECDPGGRCASDPPQAAARCDPANYLDLAPASRSGEDNAAFHDRSDAARGANADGFIQGLVHDASGSVAVNDRLAVLTPRDLMPRVMRRVALEAAHGLAAEAAARGGRYPAPEPACLPAPYGRIPEATLDGWPAWWPVWSPFVLYAPGEPEIDAVDEPGNVVRAGRRIAVVVTPSPGQCGTPRLRCDALRCRQVMISPAHDHAFALAH